jgi:hypothetical protein
VTRKKPAKPERSPSPQPSGAEQAFLALAPELEAFTGAIGQRVLVDVQVASAVAHSVALRDREPERRSSFQRLADVELYDMTLPQRVGQLALATWFTRQRQLGRLALTSAASVPPDTLRKAQLTRRRMLKVLEHWFDDDPEIMAEVAAIRAGAGHQDLANDLEALADMYRRKPIETVIRKDAKHYLAADVDTARSLARAIFGGLGLGRKREAKRWGVLCLRAWTLLLADYEEHRVAGVFLFRKLENTAETYPSLFTAARRPPSARANEGDARPKPGDGLNDSPSTTADASESAAG